MKRARMAGVLLAILLAAAVLGQAYAAQAAQRAMQHLHYAYSYMQVGRNGQAAQEMHSAYEEIARRRTGLVLLIGRAQLAALETGLCALSEYAVQENAADCLYELKRCIQELRLLSWWM